MNQCVLTKTVTFYLKYFQLAMSCPALFQTNDDNNNDKNN